MKRIFAVAGMLVAISAAISSGQTAPTTTLGQSEQAVLGLTADWLAAEARHDGSALNRIIADEFVGTAPGGAILGKRDLVPADPGEPAGGLEMGAADLVVHAFGDAAVVTGRGLPKGPQGGALRFTLVYVKRQDRWQMVAAHLSGVPRP